MPIEAILFDLGKVLLDFDLDPVLGKFISSCREPEQFRRVFFDSELAYRYECGGITTAEFHDHLCRFGGLQMDVSAFRSAWTSMFHPNLLLPEDLLTGLRRRYPLILVSNTNEAHAAYIADRYPLFGYFEHKVFSFEVGAMKPDARIYRRAIELSGKAAQSLFFVDDREENVLGARALGIHAHQFSSEASLIEALHAAGVEW